jgi:hypothetical protein
MADLVITPGSVIAGANATKVQGIAGETILAGQPIARDSVTRKLLKADNNAANADLRTPIGIALHGASLDQPLMIQTEGDINLGAALTVGVPYFLGDAPGGICPLADLTSGEFVNLLGIASSAANLKMKILVSTAAVP